MRRGITTALLFWFAFGPASATAAAETLKAATTATVYKADGGTAEVTVVALEPIAKGDALIRVDASNSSLDGLIVRHRAKTQGASVAYVVDVPGSGEHTRLRVRDDSKQYSLFVPEQPTREIKLKLDVKASKALVTADFLKLYEAQDAKAVQTKLEKAYE
jgi:hypothetical protein